MNYNTQTGIPYGVISGNTVPGLVDDIITHGINLDYQSWESETLEMLESARASDDPADSLLEVVGEYLNFDFTDDILDYGNDELIGLMAEYIDFDEPTYKWESGGYSYYLTWLGGGILVYVCDGQTIGKYDLCSPCVPGAGNLDSPNPDGIECYDVPPEYRD